jgi:hypothetical protein
MALQRNKRSRPAKPADNGAAETPGDLAGAIRVLTPELGRANSFGEQMREAFAGIAPETTLEALAELASCHVNGPRRTSAQMEILRAQIYVVLSTIQPATVRQTFYQLVRRAIIAKTENEYKHLVIPLLTKLRREGVIPWNWIRDNTRWMRKPKTYSSLQRMLDEMQGLYRRDVWNNQPVYVEIWLEKDALSGVLYQETAAWDVPLMVTKGYASVSYLHDAAETIIGHGKPTYIYYVGDWDPSGLDITRATEAGLREYAPNAQIHFERIAVTKEQIITMGLPTRPTKKKDSRSKNFRGESVEVDAIDPNDLRRIVRSVIIQHIDRRLLRETQEQEERDRELLRIMPKGW